MENYTLLKHAQDGDSESFYILMDQHKIQLYKIAYFYLKNEQDALEAIQEITYRCFIKIKKVKEPKYFSTWLIRMMINYCKDQLRKQRRMNNKNIEQNSVVAEDNQLQITDRMVLEAALMELDDKYEKVIRMKYIGDMTIPQIAYAIGKPEGTIKTWIYKGLSKLRSQLEKGRG
ncbi:sigma-70 family RNA polymerase sigma factor [Longirhabdus pacifica]|uniref:sigma-70 family RNA polymerase sigma factor n=1 Tax=Longirhabdus pacifica TaxID=2305227 RepID=UPI001008F2A1|nr:sigma-70 family RNA polymerase sigma factor [Longirhabdus pacifica]